jgi:hypothetical protein
MTTPREGSKRKPKKPAHVDSPARRNKKPVFGWLEHVDLPELRVYRLRAKLDTGAKSSALHVDNLRMLSPHRATFDVVLDSGRVRHVTARVSRTARVKSSNGHYDRRVFVETRMRIGNIERDVEISLVDREEMLHRMLVGRTSLKGLLVDPARRYLHDEDR